MHRQVEIARQVAGCVTHARLLASPAAFGSHGPGIVMTFLEPAPLRARGVMSGATMRLRLMVGQDVMGSPVLREYRYAVDDALGGELLAWHLHPNSNVAAPSFPHLHVSAPLRPAASGGERGLLPLDKRHLPTGVVSLAAFVRMLIEEFGVEPLARDWQARLAER